MKLQKGEFNKDLDCSEYLELYRNLKLKLKKNKIDENSIADLFQFSKKACGLSRKKIKNNFHSFFTSLVLITKQNGHQQNNHYFLRCLLAKKQGKYYRVPYSVLNKKLKLGKENLATEKNIAARHIFSNKLMSNQTEKDLGVSYLERKFQDFLNGKEETKPALRIDWSTGKVYLSGGTKLDIQNYFCMQMARSEIIILECWNLFSKELNGEEMSIFDYFFFKYIYNNVVKKSFSIFKEKVKNCTTVHHITFKTCEPDKHNLNDLKNIDPNTLPDTNFCLNEFNTFRLSGYTENSSSQYFNTEEIEELKYIFITVAKSNSFLFLTQEPIDDTFSKKIENFIRQEWDYMCMASTLRTLLVPKDSYLVTNNYFIHQLSDEDFERTNKLEVLFDKSLNFEEKIKELGTKTDRFN